MHGQNVFEYQLLYPNIFRNQILKTSIAFKYIGICILYTLNETSNKESTLLFLINVLVRYPHGHNPLTCTIV